MAVVAEETMLDVEQLREMRRALSRIDAALLTGAQCRAMAEELAGLSKAALAAAGRVGARAASCRAHESSGAADAADWLAGKLGSTRHAAKKAMETAEKVADSCPATAEALALGEVSTEEADEIVRTEAAVPGSEAALLELTRSDGLAGVREEGQRRRAAALDEAELERKRRKARSLRTWVDALGMVNVRGALLPEQGMELANRIEDEAKRRRRVARSSAGELEPHEAYAHDAFVDLLAAGDGDVAGRPRARRAEVVFVCDVGAARRGHAHPGEACHVVGGGRVPVESVMDAIDDAFVKLVTHDGVRIDAVLHLGRYRRAELQSALDLGAPPAFSGAICVEAGCTRRYGLEWDHVDPVNNQGPTCFDNLVPRCWPHHQAKTRRDREAGLLDPRRARRVNDDPRRGGPFDDAPADNDDERGPP